MTPDEKKQYEAGDTETQPIKPQHIKIKHTFESNLKLDGYVYFAQKQRQTEFKGQKVNKIIGEIKK
jgi:hypothetical protein